MMAETDESGNTVASDQEYILLFGDESPPSHSWEGYTNIKVIKMVLQNGSGENDTGGSKYHGNAPSPPSDIDEQEIGLIALSTNSGAYAGDVEFSLFDFSVVTSQTQTLNSAPQTTIIRTCVTPEYLGVKQLCANALSSFQLAPNVLDLLNQVINLDAPRTPDPTDNTFIDACTNVIISSSADTINFSLSGENALATGEKSIAYAENSTAMGKSTTASGSYSTAMGRGTTASGYASTTMGYNTKAMSYASAAMGHDTTASGYASTAMGMNTTASGTSSTAMGLGTKATADNSTAMGHVTRVGLLKDIKDALSSIITASTGLKTHYDSFADDADQAEWQTTFQSLAPKYAAAINKLTSIKTLCADAKPKFSDTDVLELFTNIAALTTSPPSLPLDKDAANTDADKLATFIDKCTTAQVLTIPIQHLLSGVNGLATGNNTKAYAQNSTAMGQKTVASAVNSTAMGHYTTASGISSTAMGTGTKASGDVSTAMGTGTTAEGKYSTAMGHKTQVGLWKAINDAASKNADGVGMIEDLSSQVIVVFGEMPNDNPNGDTNTGVWTDWYAKNDRVVTAYNAMLINLQRTADACARVKPLTEDENILELLTSVSTLATSLLDDLLTTSDAIKVNIENDWNGFITYTNAIKAALATKRNNSKDQLFILEDNILTVSASESIDLLLGEAGQATGSNSLAVATNSTAMGADTTASGTYSTAMGGGTNASGTYSTAMGQETKALGWASTAMGNTTIASGGASTAMGYNTEAKYDYSTAMGYNTEASGISSTAMGNDTEASGKASTAMGFQTQTGVAQQLYNAFPVVRDTGITLYARLKSWNDANADDLELEDLRHKYNNALKDYSELWVQELTTAKEYFSSTSEEGMWLTNAFNLYEMRSSTLGEVATLGEANAAIDLLNQIFDVNDDNGEVTIKDKFNLDPFPSTLSGEHALATGEKSIAYAKNSTAMGTGTIASGESSTAMGDYTEASGNYSTAMGTGTIASGESSTAMGDYTEASGNYSTAMGQSTEASGMLSTAMGQSTEASGMLSTAMGTGTIASSKASTTMGLNTQVGLWKGINDAASKNADGKGMIENLSLQVIDVFEKMPTDKTDAIFPTTVELTQNAAEWRQWYAEYDQVVTAYNTMGGNLRRTANACKRVKPLTEEEEILQLLTSVSNLATSLLNDSLNLSDIIKSQIENDWDGFNTSQSTIKTELEDKIEPSKTHLSTLETNIETVTIDLHDINSIRLVSGENGLAAGSWSLAVARNSTAMGVFTVASGTTSTAMGDNTKAEGDASTAMGHNTKASGNLSTAMGLSTVASGTASTAMGDRAHAKGNLSTAMGLSTVASGIGSTAMGADTEASGEYSTAMGYHTKASGEYSTAIGHATQTGVAQQLYDAFNEVIDTGPGLYAILDRFSDWNDDDKKDFEVLKQKYNSALNDQWNDELHAARVNFSATSDEGEWLTKAFNYAEKRNSTLAEVATPEEANAAIALLKVIFDVNDDTDEVTIKTGFNLGDAPPKGLSGQNALATGESSIAYAKNSTAMGTGTIASGESSTAMGKYNKPDDGNDPYLLSVGNGTTDNARSNALAVASNGTVVAADLECEGASITKVLTATEIIILGNQSFGTQSVSLIGSSAQGNAEDKIAELQEKYDVLVTALRQMGIIKTP